MQTVSFPITTTSISDLLAEGADCLKAYGIDTPRLEAEHLLAAVCDCERLHLYLDPQKQLSPADCSRFRHNLKRRAAHEPLQYITGQVEFCGLSLFMSSGVFIPRPETELIVEVAGQMTTPPQKILDLCTGSGALAIALSHTFPAANVIAVDCSEQALTAAARNVKRLCQSLNVTLLSGDLFEPLKHAPFESTRFDLIVCNPPYIPESDRPTLPPEVRDHEPDNALFAPDEGRAFYRRILAAAPEWLADDGLILLEMGIHQSEWLLDFIEKETRFEVKFIPDWAKIDRIACISRQKDARRGQRNG